ncbi:MAG: hypothetical protein AAGH67_14185 [Cyanobacteria bacterium P01_H01_bin.162]
MSPIPPVGPWTMVGQIASITWVPEHQEPAVPGMSGMLGCDRTFPAHYRVLLRTTHLAFDRDPAAPRSWSPESLPTEVTLPHRAPPPPAQLRKRFWRWLLQWFKKFWPRQKPKRSRPEPRGFILKLPRAEPDGFLQTGMTIRVVGYCELGDEGGIWTEFKQIDVLPSSTQSSR